MIPAIRWGEWRFCFSLFCRRIILDETLRITGADRSLCRRYGRTTFWWSDAARIPASNRSFRAYWIVQWKYGVYK